MKGRHVQVMCTHQTTQFCLAGDATFWITFATRRRPAAAVIGPDLELESPSVLANSDAALVFNRSVIIGRPKVAHFGHQSRRLAAD